MRDHAPRARPGLRFAYPGDLLAAAVPNGHRAIEGPLDSNQERSPLKRIIAAVALVAAMSGVGLAQASATQRARPFDLVSGIVFTCAGATGFPWTGEDCDGLASEFRKRAEALKLPFARVPIAADFRTARRAAADGFDQDKAVRVFCNFTESSGRKGSVKADLSASRVWEPTAKDIPNVAPGQRIPMNFYAQSVTFDPGATLSQAEPYLRAITDAFFQVGEGKI
jgi:hypothetical protein